MRDLFPSMLVSSVQPLLCCSMLAVVAAPALAAQGTREELWASGESEVWRSEQQGAAAAATLKDLAHVVETGEWGEQSAAEFLDQGARCNRLRPELAELRNARGLQVSAAPEGSFGELPDATLAFEGLSEFFAPLAGGQDIAIATKVVGVESTAADRWSVSVYVHTSARFGEARVQQNAEWRVGCVLQDAEAGVRFTEFTASKLDEVRLERPWFADRTGAVLDVSEPTTRLLASGSERWFASLDNLGEPHYFGHNGMAVGDVNGDDLDDLYVATGTGLPNMLFVQRPDGSYEERGQGSGAEWLDDTKGVLLVDLDGDGDRDLVCAIGPVLVVSANDGEGHFAPLWSLGSESTSSFYSLSAADYDLDGDLDLFAVRYVDSKYGESVPVPLHDANNGPKNHLMRNDGEAGFIDVSAEVGLDVNNTRFSLASAWSDYDQDGDPDLYVANDFGRNNLYRNDEGHFVDVAAEAQVEDQAAGMGVAWGDVDLDGRFDLLVSNMFSSAGRRIAYQDHFQAERESGERAALQRHSLGNSLFCPTDGDGFEEVSEQAGVRMGRWSWGSSFCDFDGDGLRDIYVPNGFLTNDADDDL